MTIGKEPTETPNKHKNLAEELDKNALEIVENDVETLEVEAKIDLETKIEEENILIHNIGHV